MDNNKMIWQNAMSYGAILGLSLVFLSVLGYILDIQDSVIIGMLNYVVMAVLLFMGSKTFRDKYLNGYIKYGKALASSFLIGLFGGIILAFYIYIFMKYIDPSILEKMKIMTEQKMIDRGLPDDQVDISLKMINAGIIAVGTIFSFAFWSFIFGLIIAFFVRKENEGGKITA